ncbi:hypothetical protein NL676_028672 [Syzygium grande]|nr:hypothetical protein NL676_028672 [Syzygium grande]
MGDEDFQNPSFSLLYMASEGGGGGMGLVSWAEFRAIGPGFVSGSRAVVFGQSSLSAVKWADVTRAMRVSR